MNFLDKFEKPWRLDFGVLYNKKKGYIGIDLNQTQLVDIRADFRYLSFVADNSIESIYSFDSIEHIPFRDLKPTLLEWYRVLNSGGYVEIETPDFQESIKMWQQGRYHEAMQFIFGSQSFNEDYHCLALDENFLRTLLSECGFEKIERYTVCVDGSPARSGLCMRAFKP